MRGETKCSNHQNMKSSFQSTHPMRGETLCPPAGLAAGQYFNPLTPCGVRRRRCGRLRQKKQFQSTHPMRGETRALQQCCQDRRNFNPLTPCGVRRIQRVHRHMVFLFQSTHPMRGETSHLVRKLCGGHISIHSPHAG